jgi:streptogramin lyase
MTDYASSQIDGPDQIVAGPDYALWFTDQTNNTIGRISG